MRFDLIKTRKGRLVRDLKYELATDKPNLNRFLEIIREYENNNLNTIEKLKRVKVFEAKRISGALKQTIHSHGPITKELIGSATKRIMGALLIDVNKTNKSKYQNLLKKRTLVLVFIIILLLSLI